MPYVISFFDDPDVFEKKKELRAVHLEYVSANAGKIIASGGFFPDEDDFPVGGLIILDVENRQQAVEYIENDPFFVHRVFSDYKVDRWKKFVFDHKRVTV
ncbi:YciI family protein [Pseudomonas sp. NPDC089996]|uniref:YciI family protein n=1 Tax=Pseudomonas sp. NPDC089996 TaxID=3364474 RepID=UPI003830D2FE